MKREAPAETTSSNKRQETEQVTTVRISGINGTEESHSNVAFFQQDHDGLVITRDSGFGGAYTFNLNTCLAIILVRKEEIEVVHTTAADIEDMVSSLRCDRAVIITGGDDGIRADVLSDPYEKEHEKTIHKMIEERNGRAQDLMVQISEANGLGFEVRIATAHSGAIFVGLNGSVKELADHTVSLVENHGLEFCSEDLTSHDYRFNRDGAFELIEKSPSSTSVELRGLTKGTSAAATLSKSSGFKRD